MNKITWTIADEAFWHYREANKLAKAIIAAGNIAQEDEGFAINYAHWLVTTSKVEFGGGARQALKNLVAFLARWQDLSPAELWDYYQKEIPQSLASEWHKAYTAAQNLFDPDPAEVPEYMLTPEQKAEAATPGSPLTLPVPLSQSA